VPPAEPASELLPPAEPAPTALAEEPLMALSPDAVDFAATRTGPLGVAVVVPSDRMVYTLNGDELFPMASVSKIAIMVTLMDRAMREGRDLTDQERALLEPMITVSDNDAATALWTDIGGAEAVDSYLRFIGVSNIRANPKDEWGASLASPRDVALLLAKLAGSEILDETMRATALDLMSSIEPNQRWGVPAGLADETPPRTVIAIKNGWYETAYGRWWVNSAGVIIPSDAHPMYAITVLTKHQTNFEYGVETIEGIAARIHAALRGVATREYGPG
jgi:beta-lactamase class A